MTKYSTAGSVRSGFGRVVCFGLALACAGAGCTAASDVSTETSAVIEPGAPEAVNAFLAQPTLTLTVTAADYDADGDAFLAVVPTGGGNMAVWLNAVPVIRNEIATNGAVAVTLHPSTWQWLAVASGPERQLQWIPREQGAVWLADSDSPALCGDQSVEVQDPAAEITGMTGALEVRLAFGWGPWPRPGPRLRECNWNKCEGPCDVSAGRAGECHEHRIYVPRGPFGGIPICLCY